MNALVAPLHAALHGAARRVPPCQSSLRNMQSQAAQPHSDNNGALDRRQSRLYPASMSKTNKKGKAIMLGVGLDSDGHKRITTGENFALIGGTQETHEVMTEKIIKINEELKSRGKHLETITGKEFDDIAEEVGLKKVNARKSRRLSSSD
jgi:hypothetical protein